MTLNLLCLCSVLVDKALCEFDMSVEHEFNQLIRMFCIDHHLEY